MAKMVENEILLADKMGKNKMKQMSKMDHSMAHKHANSVLADQIKLENNLEIQYFKQN